MVKARVGQRVRISDPVRVAVRFFNRETAQIRGAGGLEFDRTTLDLAARVAEIGVRGTRALIAWDGAATQHEGICASMWLDADCIERA